MFLYIKKLGHKIVGLKDTNNRKEKKKKWEL